MDLLIFGLGYSATRFLVLHRQHFETVTATVREMAERRTSARDMKMIPFDGRRGSPELAEALQRATHLLVSIPPDEGGDPVLRNVEAQILAAPRLGWIGYLSTVGVYGDFDGGWVDEET